MRINWGSERRSHGHFRGGVRWRGRGVHICVGWCSGVWGVAGCHPRLHSLMPLPVGSLVVSVYRLLATRHWQWFLGPAQRGGARGAVVRRSLRGGKTRYVCVGFV